MAKQILLILSFFVVSLGYGQTVKIPVSTNIQQRDGKSFYVHKVEKSQTVYSIAKAYHVGIDEIYYANPEAKNGLRIGQELFIPTINKEQSITTEVKKTNFDFFYHVAAGNETFSHISSIYVIPERYIHLANPGLKDPLKEGEYVKIPVESAFPILDGKVTTSYQTPKQYGGGLDIEQTHPKPLTQASEKANQAVRKKETSQPIRLVQKPNHVTTSSIPVIKDYRHVVVRGETLESIAEKYEISPSLLKQVNPGLRIAVQGQRLRLPQTAKVPGYHAPQKPFQKTMAKKRTPKPVSKKQAPQNKPRFITHRVQKKETLYSISRKYGVSLNELYRANPGLTTHIKIGQTLRVPKKKITEPYLIYSSFKKISLKKVARLYQMDYELLKRKNPSVGRKVHAGQMIRIPLDKKLIEASNKIPEQATQPAKTPEQTLGNTTTPVMAGRCMARPHTRTFKVALMVPLYLEEIDSLDINQFMLQNRKHFKPFRFIQFLEGALMATDSLQKQGMKLEFHVYDVDEKLTKASKVLSKPELKEMDLIIGPFYSRSFNQIALFANHFNIPIVNPLTFRNQVVEQFSEVVKVKPDKNYDPGLLAALIKADYPNHKVFFIRQNTFQDNMLIDQIRDSIQSILPDKIKIPNSQLIDYGIRVTQREKEAAQLAALKESDSDEKPTPIEVSLSDTLHLYKLENQWINPDSLKFFPEDSTLLDNSLTTITYAYDSIHPFENQASVVRNNLIILYGTQKSFVMDAMNRLNVLQDTFPIQMVGVPEWENFSNLDLNQMNNLQVTYPSSYFVDYQNPSVQNYVEDFKSRFKTDPETYGILGFDICYYFMENLFQYGNHMLPCLENSPKAGLSTHFRFTPAMKNENSYENTYWNILRISNFTQRKRRTFIPTAIKPSE